MKKITVRICYKLDLPCPYRSRNYSVELCSFPCQMIILISASWQVRYSIAWYEWGKSRVLDCQTVRIWSNTSYDTSLEYQTDSLTTTKPNTTCRQYVYNNTSYDTSLDYQTDSLTTTKPNTTMQTVKCTTTSYDTSLWQSYNHEAQHNQTVQCTTLTAGKHTSLDHQTVCVILYTVLDSLSLYSHLAQLANMTIMYKVLCNSVHCTLILYDLYHVLAQLWNMTIDKVREFKYTVDSLSLYSALHLANMTIMIGHVILYTVLDS